jgi:hypothetical protein
MPIVSIAPASPRPTKLPKSAVADRADVVLPHDADQRLRDPDRDHSLGSDAFGTEWERS